MLSAVGADVEFVAAGAIASAYFGNASLRPTYWLLAP